MKETSIIHEIPAVWDYESRILLLGTMPSPASRKAGFFYMHPQNRFWSVLSSVFDEEFKVANHDFKKLGVESNNENKAAEIFRVAIQERRDFLLRHNIALWDVLSSCDINGASDASIKNAVANDFSTVFSKSKIKRIFCTGKTAFNLWNKLCAEKYEAKFKLKSECLPSTSPANASWPLEKLIKAYSVIV